MTETQSALTTRTGARRFARSINVVQLVLGLGIGQGSLFLAQTWLVHSHQLEFLGQFGTMFSFAMLGVYIVDMGTVTTLARAVAHPSIEPDRAVSIWRLYWSASVIRLLSAVIILVIALGVAIALNDRFALNYIAAGAVGILVWSFNAAGLLDGLRRSGFSGLSIVFPYVASAAVLPLVAHADLAVAALALGAALTFGNVVSVATQLLGLRRMGFPLRMASPLRSEITQAGKEGVAMLVYGLPGQLFYRVQIVLCGAFLGQAMTGLFVYAKQIINALAQLIGFMRRVEFPRLVSVLARSSTQSLAEILLTLRSALVAAAAASAGLAVAALLAKRSLAGGLGEAAGIVMLFSPIVLTSGVTQALAQGFFALGRLGIVASSTSMAMLIGIPVNYVFIKQFSLTGLVAGEIVVHLVSIGLVLLRYRAVQGKGRLS